MLGEMVEPTVRELEKEFSGKMAFEILDYKKGDNPALIKKYGFTQHGMVITDEAGKKVWGEDSHNQQKDVVAKVIKGLVD